MLYGREETIRTHRKKKGQWKKLLLFVMLLLILYLFVEPLLVTTEFVTLSSRDLPRDVGQLRLVYVTDIHDGAFPASWRTRQVIEKINRLNADIVLFGGDYGQNTQGSTQFFETMRPIVSRYGAYGVLGEHDRSGTVSENQKLLAAMRKAGVEPLVNQVAPVTIGRSQIYLVGMDSTQTVAMSMDEIASRIRSEDYTIFLHHSPEAIAEAHRATDSQGRANWFDLGLFGHTHGGQVALLGKLLNLPGVLGQYEHGWFLENRIDMLVSNGIGTTGLPVRLMRPPQIHVITIVHR